jgi:hypothetical protein
MGEQDNVLLEPGAALLVSAAIAMQLIVVSPMNVVNMLPACERRKTAKRDMLREITNGSFTSIRDIESVATTFRFGGRFPVTGPIGY